MKKLSKLSLNELRTDSEKVLTKNELLQFSGGYDYCCSVSVNSNNYSMCSGDWSANLIYSWANVWQGYGYNVSCGQAWYV